MAVVVARRGEISRESKKFGARYDVLASIIHNYTVQPIQSESMTCGLSDVGVEFDVISLCTIIRLVSERLDEGKT